VTNLARDPQLQHHLENGWQALQQRNYTASQEAFQQAKAIAPDFEEIQHWFNYAVNLEQAYRAVRGIEQDDDPEPRERLVAFRHAVQALDNALGEVQLKANEILPALPPQLPTWRRQAVWDAQELHHNATELVKLYEQYNRHYLQGDIDVALALLDPFEQQRIKFLDLHQNPTTPPRGFMAGSFSVGGIYTVSKSVAEPVESSVGAPTLTPHKDQNDKPESEPAPMQPEVDPPVIQVNESDTFTEMTPPEEDSSSPVFRWDISEFLSSDDEDKEQE
jgi:hypothetical protein